MSGSNLSSDESKNSSRLPRAIVLCFDGTHAQFDSTNTNVVKLCGLLRKDCPHQQMVYYQPGIGTYFSPGIVSPLWTHLASLLDEAVAWYLDEHVMGGYKFLMNNYRAGDKICLFGFSRGAYTARALAGMLDKVGLLPKGNLQQVNFAYKAYTRTDVEGIKFAAGFKRTFSQDVKIDFLGVWDTVQSTGVLISRELPFTDSNTAIRVFRHALSLDERRARFRPTLYHWPERDHKSDKAADAKDSPSPKLCAIRAFFQQWLKRILPRYQPQQKVGYGTFTDSSAAGNAEPALHSNAQQKRVFFPDEQTQTDVLEVWFSGCHSDVGGGNVADDVDVSLAQITLRWMIEEIIKSRCGIVFDSDKLARIGFTLDSQGAWTTDAKATIQDTLEATVVQGSLKDERNQSAASGSSLYADRRDDAIAPLFDALKTNILWWILEIFPVSSAWQDANCVWHNDWRVNFGRGRLVPFQKPKFHRSVKQRMDCPQLKYKPRAMFNHEEVYI